MKKYLRYALASFIWLAAITGTQAQSMQVFTQQTVGDIRDGSEKAAFTVSYTLNPNVHVKPPKDSNGNDPIKDSDGNYTFSKGENGKYQVVFTDDKGEEHKVETDGFPFTVKDGSGTTYEVAETGEVKPVSTSGSSVKLDEATKEKQSSLAVVEFQATNNTKYALDQYKEIYAKVTEYFLKYKPTTKDMIASAKFMLPGASDEIFVKVVETKAGFDATKVHFVTDKGQEYKGVYDASKNGWTLTVVGGAANDGQHLYVVQEKSKGKYETLARLNIFTYDAKNVKVKLVPVNGFTNGFTAQSVNSQLNAIYNKVGITCEVEMAQPFNYTFVGNTFNVTGSGLFSTQTDDMKAINAAYLQANPDENAICLFIIENVTGNEGVVGDMPRGKQFGYLFSGATAQTVAHEIGHGFFHLDHPFDRTVLSKSFDRGDLADNLMEYGNGTNLVKLQWDAVHAPGLVIGAFETDKSGMRKEEEVLKVLAQIVETLKATGENGCAFVRKNQKTSNVNQEAQASVETLNLDYLIGKYENEILNLGIVTGKFTQIDILSSNMILEENKTHILYVANGNVQYCYAKEDYSQFADLNKAKDNAVFKQKFIADLLNCKSEIAQINVYVTEFLQKIQSAARINQSIEFSYNNNSYALKDGNLQKVELSDNDINAGNWTDGNIDYKIRFGFDSDGNLKIQALGIRKNIQIATGKTASLNEISTDMMLKGNLFLKEYGINRNNLDITIEEKGVSLDSDAFPDGKKVEIDKKAKFLKVLYEAGGIAVEFLKTAEIEKPVYEESKENTIKAPPIATGSAEAVARAVTDITSMVTFAYDVIVDKETRKETIDGFNAIKDQIADDPKSLFPLLKDVILEEATGSTGEQYAEMFADQTDNGRKQHLVSKTAVRTTVIVFASGKFLAKLPQMATDIAKKMARAKGLKKFRLNDLKDLIKNFEKKLNDLPDKGEKFLKDFENATDDEIRRFLEKPDLVDNWKHLDDAGVDETVRKSMSALDDVDAVEDAVQATGKAKPTWTEIQALWKRGNDFNRKASKDYRYNEINLINGKRLDSYNAELGEIVSRKATTLNEIQKSTFEKYLSELKNRYPEGTIIRSNKYPELDGKPLIGKQILEIPENNKSFSRIQEYIDLAKNKYNVEIRFKPE